MKICETFVMFYAIWHHLYNLKNVKNNHGGGLLLVKLQALLKVTLLHGCFSRFFKLYKWHQIAQRITFCQVFPLCYLCSMHKIFCYPKMTISKA